MENLLLRLYLIAALMQLGISLKDISSLSNKNHLNKIDSASHKILKIDWKPISVFPNEARRFK